MDLSKWINKKVSVSFLIKENNSVTGTLKSYSQDSMVLVDNSNIEGIIPYSAVMMIIKIEDDENAPQDQ